MSAQAPPSRAPDAGSADATRLRIAFLGAQSWLDACCPPQAASGVSPIRIATDGTARSDRLADALGLRPPDVTVVFDPGKLPRGELEGLPGVTLGVLVGGLPPGAAVPALAALDRLVSFRPALTGQAVGEQRIWRAIPPPVSDALFADVRPLHGRPRAMAVGRSTPFRERMLLPAKHHHDLLQVIHGVSGEPLIELLREHDVGVYFPPVPGGGFGAQVGMHLAAGHLLLTEDLIPDHGLERNIDYLYVDSADELVWILDRLTRFPEMHQRIRIRGRLKAEQYRASRLFARIGHDLIADVAAFGSARRPSRPRAL